MPNDPSSIDGFEFLKKIYGVRLGPGEFYRPSEGNGSDASIDVARMWFLLALRTKASRELRQFARDVGPAYEELVAKRDQKCSHVTLRWPEPYFVLHDLADPTKIEAGEEYTQWFCSAEVQRRIESGEYSVDPWGEGHWPELQPEFCRFQMCFLNWLSRVKLNQDWIVEALLDALHDELGNRRAAGRARPFGSCWENATSGQGVPAYSEEFVYTVDSQGASSEVYCLEEDSVRASSWRAPKETVRRFVYRHASLNPQFYRWELIEDWIREEFERAIAAYRESVEGFYVSKGFKHTPKKLNHAHFELLVERLVGGKTISELARDYVLTEKAIEAAIRDTCKAMGMPKPLFSGGRPKKPRAKSVRKENPKPPKSRG